MSLFIAGLALESDQIIDMAKIGTLVASLTAGIVGSLVLLGAYKRSISEPGLV